VPIFHIHGVLLFIIFFIAGFNPIETFAEYIVHR